MKTVLSTKVLTSAQKELFLNSGLGLVEYDALHIELLDVDISVDMKNLIFTSKNAVHAFLKAKREHDCAAHQAFCVGSKTAGLLEEHGIQVVKMEENALQLGDFISKNYPNEGFLFLCGNMRRDELPHTLKKNNIHYKEIEVYRTLLTPKAFKRDFDGILFFSPSGIRSHFSENCIGNSILFCIGETTASEAKEYTDKVVVANVPTVENVLVQAIKYLKIYD